jgi:hypothetical protein
MKDNRNDNRIKNGRDDRDNENIDQDKVRDSTMNETIREVSGNPDRNLNDVRKEGREVDDNERSDLRNVDNIDETRGVNYNPNDASAVRSGGIADMDDQTAGGAGFDTGVRKGLGSHLTPKRGVSGSDFDGQNSTS